MIPNWEKKTLNYREVQNYSCDSIPLWYYGHSQNTECRWETCSGQNHWWPWVSLLFLCVAYLLLPYCLQNIHTLFHHFYWCHLSLVVFLFPTLCPFTPIFHTMAKVIFFICKSYLSSAAKALCCLEYKSTHLYNWLWGPTPSTSLAFLVSTASTIPLACFVAATVPFIFFQHSRHFLPKGQCQALLLPRSFLSGDPSDCLCHSPASVSPCSSVPWKTVPT